MNYKGEVPENGDFAKFTRPRDALNARTWSKRDLNEAAKAADACASLSEQQLL